MLVDKCPQDLVRGSGSAWAIRTGQVQNPVGLAWLAILAFQGLDALALFGGLLWTLIGISLMATNPTMQGLRCTANSGRWPQ